jgi:hypothetical protein
MTNYTKPTLRERIKSRIKNSNVGGTASGKWSARKSQILAKRYEEAGGSYDGKKNKEQKSLSFWSKSKWRTKSGEPSSKTGERYLPSKVIDKLSSQQYGAASRTKRAANKRSQQYSSYSPNLNRVMRGSGIY